MELDSIRLYKKLGRIYDDIWLVCKDGSFIHEQAERDEQISKWCSFKFRYMFSFPLIFKLRSFIRKNNISNVIFFGASELRSIFFALLGMNINLIIRHGTTKSRKKKDPFHQLIYSNVSHHIGISRHLVKNIYEILPITKKTQVNLIYSSLEFAESARNKKNNEDGVVNIIHVGRLAGGKGQDVAIRACSILHSKGIPFRLVFVGTGDEAYCRWLEKVRDSLPYKESITFHGYTDDVFSLLNSSDVFLFPSAGEGLPNALIEALSCGLVCIVYSNTVFPEIFDLGFYGHLVEDGNEVALQNKLLTVCENIEKEMMKAEGNIKIARQAFSEDREIYEYGKIFI